MATNKEMTAVLPDSEKVSFKIQKCDLKITVDSDFKFGTYEMSFDLLKIAEGEDTWTITSHFKENDFDLLSIRSRINGKLNGNLKSVPIKRDDQKACHKIFLDKIDLNNSEPYHFKIIYREKLASTKIGYGYLLFKRHFVSFFKMFPNYCRSFNINVEFKKKRVKILASNPNDCIQEKKLILTKEYISPLEYTTLSFMTISGLLINKNSGFIEKIFWSSGIIAWIVKFIIDYFKNGNN